MSVIRDVIVVDNEVGIRPLEKLSCSLYVPSYPLAEAAHIIGVERGPGGCVIGVLTWLAIIHELAHLFIKYWQSHDTGDGCVIPSAVSNGRLRIFGVFSGVGRMVHKRMRCATGCSGVDWFPIAILGGKECGAVSVSTLGV